MKKSLIVLAVAVFVLSFTALGTIAYFTSQGTATNHITAGNVKLELHDEIGDGVPFPEEGKHDVMPGSEFAKEVYVENVGSNPFYTRVKLTTTVQAGETTLSAEGITLNIDTENWELGQDGWYYYKNTVAVGAATEPLFTEVSFSTALGNEYMDAEVDIDVVAQAVQSENNGGSATGAAGWPAV